MNDAAAATDASSAGDAPESDHPALRPGRSRFAAGGHRPGGDLGDLPVRERPLPHRGQPHQPDAADHRHRPDLGRRRLRAAARRDRPLGRRRQRARGRRAWPSSTSSTAGARISRSPRRSRSGRRSASLQGSIFTRFVMPSFVVTLAGLLAWQGALLQVLGSTGTINITDPKITGLANTFYSDTVGWVIAIVAIAAYGAVLVVGHRRRIAAGPRQGPVPRCRPSASHWSRRSSSPRSSSSTPTAACRWPS